MIQTALFPEKTLLGLGRPFISATQPNSNASEVIGPLWAEMSKLFFSMSLSRDANPVGYGAMWNDVDGEPGAMMYFAGYEIHEIPEDLGGLEVLALDETKYAFIEHNGPMSELPQKIKAFYTEHLPSSNFKRIDGIDLEIYHESDNSELPPRVIVAAPVL